MGSVTSSSFRAVLWDMDGTIVDSEPYWITAEAELVRSFGGSWSKEQALELVGSALENSARILQEAGVKMGVEEIIAHLTTRVVEQFSEFGVPFRPGARELLHSLREAGIPSALVTMSMRRMAEHVASLIGFPAFDVIVGGDDVVRPKPWPEPYLQAAEMLGVDPGDTIAIEDSPTGLRSAISAGTVSVGVPHIVSLDEIGADVLLPTLQGVSVSDLNTLFLQKRAVR